MTKHVMKWLSVVLAAAMLLSGAAISVGAEPADEEPAPDVQNEAAHVSENAAVLQFNNTAEGTQIGWNACEGAAVYELYLSENDAWTLLTQTESRSFLHTPLEGGKEYSYRLKALDENGQEIEGYTAEAVNVFIVPPVITSLTGKENGVLIEWEPCEGAENYRIYYYGKNGWTKMAETTETSFLDTDVRSGNHYTYTVRCISADGSRFTSYHNSGKKLRYIAEPVISSIDNTATGAKLSWSKPGGAAKCRLYVKDGDGWTRLTETADTSYVHDKLKAGQRYTYTIRCVDDKGDFLTDYNHDGWENTFIEPPVITSLSSADKGVMIRWNAPKGAENYRVYYYGSKGWTKLTETTGTSFLDTDVRSGNHYTYTVRCISADGSRFTSYHNSGKKTQYIGQPTISSVVNTETGAKLSWQKPRGAAKCRVYVKDGSGWTRLTETADTSYVHDKLKSGQRYTYTIRCVDDKGDFLTDYNHDGWSNTFIGAPVISSLTNTDKGVMIRWNAPKGAENYRVYYYGSKGWTKLTETTGTSFLDTDVRSGNHYTYTVRCISADGSRFTSYHNSGKKTQYIGMPAITAFSNTETGTKITWSCPKGSSKYRVYVKGGSGWTRLTETSSSSYVHDKLKNNTEYTYTVRCVNGSGDLVSDYNGDGWKNTFIEPPKISGVSRSGDANLVKWNAVAGAAAYRVYRKGFKGSWERIVDSVAETSYSDTTAKADTLYAYTVRCLDENGDTVSDYFGSDTYYYNGKLASGTITVNGNKLNFENGRVRMGYQKINGKTYYYGSNGSIQKNGIVGSASDGYCYADKNGVIDFGYCNGVTDGGSDWNVIEGRAKRVSSDSDRTLFRALKVVNQVTDSSMTREQKLKACFNHLKNGGYTEKNPRIPHYTGMDWPIIYANDIFVNKTGNCISFAAAFCYMAKGIGYTDVYGCHSGGHGWAEVNGLVYDPEWSMHNFNYSYYGMSYNEPCDVKYKSAISAGYAWMHIKI
ncbi:MAG: hypothetical protein IJG87_00585 [Ruminococcus sp.]|nr:hypothetical protein [Ruminococcus sp.]